MYRVRRRFCKPHLKSTVSNSGGGGGLQDLRVGEASGIPGVRVKSVKIGRNTSGASGSLDHF